MIDTLIAYGLPAPAAYAVVTPLLILLPILAFRALLSLVFGLLE
jgi:hypothetical protein